MKNHVYQNIFFSNPTFLKKKQRTNMFNYGIPEVESLAEEEDENSEPYRSLQV